uniref:Gamma-glutamyltranspeptidase 1-like n=1 Tax=Saccoglossus kowalevskii TaxID=10224 RepID=A0ABM0M6V0_SACKO|nr:PREDICTED: gamma-glutamyltranspeptidase 1-like [Saccoglossus kowalevskii]
MAMDNVTTYHRITEAFKHAFAHRTGLGDEDYEDTVSDLVDLMMSKEYAAEIRERIHDNTTHDIDYYYSSFSLVEDHGTAHLSVVDQRGNSVSVTSTINTYFGSKVVGSRTGIIFNNEMDDFSSPNTTNFFEVPPSPVNFIEPGKRPLSSMDPAIVVNGQGNVSLSIGGSGGTLITTAVSLSTMNLFWFGLNLGDAILQPRIHHQLSPNELDHEEEFSDVILAGLREKNHVTSSYDRRDSVVQAIHLVDDQLHACSDDRKGGLPAGF